MKIRTFTVSLILATTLATTPVKAGFWTEVFGEVLNYFDIGGMDASSIFNVVRDNALKSMGGQINEGAGSALQMCYRYTPRTEGILGSTIELNVCNMLDSLPDLCESAPNLGAFGFQKKKFEWSMKDACEKLIGDKSKVGIEDYLGNTNTNIELFNMDTENRSSEFGDKLRYSFADTKNKHYLKAIEEGDYETLTIYNNILNTAEESNVDKIDISKINVSYNTIDEYTDSVEERVDTFRTLEDQLDVDRIKELGYNTMLSINSEYELTEEDESQVKRENAKLEAKSKLLKDYDELVDKYVKMNIKDRMMIEYKPGVLDPTKNTVLRYAEEERAKVIFVIEKQKAIQSKIIRQERRKGDTLKKIANREITRVLYATEELNEKATMKNIQKLIEEDTGS